jgi:hypothetical protein
MKTKRPSSKMHAGTEKEGLPAGITPEILRRPENRNVFQFCPSDSSTRVENADPTARRILVMMERQAVTEAH